MTATTSLDAGGPFNDGHARDHGGLAVSGPCRSSMGPGRGPTRSTSTKSSTTSTGGCDFIARQDMFFLATADGRG